MKIEKLFLRNIIDIKISIIIPVHNTENYLNQCLNSVLSQDFRDFKNICINNRSQISL